MMLTGPDAPRADDLRLAPANDAIRPGADEGALTSSALEDVPARIRHLRLPERASLIGMSAREADLALLATAPVGYLDTTHFDTQRFPPPAWAIGAFSAAAEQGALAYTGYRGNEAVLQELAASVGGFLGIPINPVSNLLLTPGTQAGLFTALSALVGTGDRVALVDPDYLFTARIIRFLGGEIGHVPLDLREGDPSPDLEMLEAEFAQKGTRLLVFSHPNNPTGAVYSSAVIAGIAQLVLKYGVTVLVDELYSRLIHEGPAFAHLAAQPGMAERVVTLLGPSKTESLSGYRLGVVVAPRAVAARIEDVLSITSLRAPAYAQHVLLPWLRDDHEWLAQRLDSFRGLREQTLSSLRQLPWLKLQRQRGTAYAWVDVSALGLPGPAVAGALLRKAGVLVSPGYQFGPASDGHFRLCYARDEGEWAHALDRVVGVLDRFATQQGLAAGASGER